MDTNTLLIIGANLLLSGIVGYGAAAFKIGEYKNKVDTIETTLGKDEHAGLRKTVGEVRDKVIACEANLTLRGPLGKAESPINLTERGHLVLEGSGGKLYVDQKKADLIEFIRAKNPKSAYDVQELAKEAMQSRVEGDDFIPLKNYAFNEGLSLEDILFVASTYLRDLALEPLGFKTEDIDKSDPSKNTQQQTEASPN